MRLTTTNDQAAILISMLNLMCILQVNADCMLLASSNIGSSWRLGLFMPKAFKLLAGGKRSATTGNCVRCQHPGGITAGIPPGCNIRLARFRWWRFAYHRLIAAIPSGCVPKQRNTLQ
jgi:hypothetical protein